MQMMGNVMPGVPGQCFNRECGTIATQAGTVQIPFQDRIEGIGEATAGSSELGGDDLG